MRTREDNWRTGNTPAAVKEPIHTDRLRLRPFTDDDLPVLHAMWSHPEVGPWIGGAHRDDAQSADVLAEHRRHQQRHGYGFWGAEDDGELVGEAGLMLFEGHGPEIEIGWCFARESWGRGLAREAAAKWLEVAFGELNQDRIIAVILPGNERSIRLARSLGMRPAGMRYAYGSEHLVFELGRAEFSHG
jgi:RimJ/RimL family protein N-acetyltransferase